MPWSRFRKKRPRKHSLSLEPLERRQLLAIDFALGVCQPQPISSPAAETDNLSHPTSSDPDLRIDRDGNEFYLDPLPDFLLSPNDADSNQLKAGPSFSPNNTPIFPDSLTVPAYSSLPSATKKIYLDFDGHMVMNSTWNNRVYHSNGYNTGSVINAPPYSTDSDLSNFSVSEQTNIREIWARVAEDFRPFNVDVTTIDPGLSAFTAGNQAIRVLISTDTDATTGQQWYPNAGGVAYLNSWYWTTDTPVWVFENRLANGNEKFTAEAASHEVGHAFNLRHDGRTSPAEGYYRGHGSGVEGWAPIMGVGYDRPLGQWSRGEYANANESQDDVAIITNGAPFRADDHGNTIASATELTVPSTGAVSETGVITTRTDLDAFKFATQAGELSLTITPFEIADGKANLDVGISLLDANGAVVATASPLDSLQATITQTVPRGWYTLVVDGVGRPATTGHAGYSDYGSLGQYDLSGQVIFNNPPIAANDSAATGLNLSVFIDVFANDVDADNDTLIISSFGPPGQGSVSLNNNQLVYTPNTGFVGQDSFQYTIFDGLNGYSTATVTVDVIPPAQVASTTVDDGTDQRSFVDQVVVVFDRIVTIDADAIEIYRQGSPTDLVDLSITTEQVNGTTIATITFAGPLTEQGSLMDGNYELFIDSSLVVDAFGNGLDGDGNGTVGGNYLFGDEATDQFFRLFGDTSGDRSVGFEDFVAFRTAFGSNDGDEDYNVMLDHDQDGAVGFTDFVQFRNRFGATI